MAGDPYKIKKNKVPAKNADTVRVLALDAATNITGYSIYDDRDLVSYGTFKTSGEKAEERIHEVKEWLKVAVAAWEPDFVGIENIQLQSFGNNQY